MSKPDRNERPTQLLGETSPLSSLRYDRLELHSIEERDKENKMPHIFSFGILFVILSAIISIINFQKFPLFPSLLLFFLTKSKMKRNKCWMESINTGKKYKNIKYELLAF